jgi:hypothetical protein
MQRWDIVLLGTPVRGFALNTKADTKLEGGLMGSVFS